MNYTLEMVVLPVSDVDRAVAFYTDQAGFHPDGDHGDGEKFRVVQFTPPGSACSVAVGIGITDAAPGTTRGLHLVVNDIDAAHAELTGRGVPVSDVRHMTGAGWQPGAYNSFAEFADPDGNVWVLQEVPGRP
jgi:catechol 2,3-dioxygenase-like lactoylglutathione lyase family enzyme